MLRYMPKRLDTDCPVLRQHHCVTATLERCPDGLPDDRRIVDHENRPGRPGALHNYGRRRLF